MIRRPPRSTLSSSSAASDVYKRQLAPYTNGEVGPVLRHRRGKTPNYLKAGHAMTEDTILGPTIALSFDRAINYAFHQNAIPMVKELRICNDAVPRRDLCFRITTDPPFAEPLELRLQALE